VRQRLHLQRGGERGHRASALQPLRVLRAGLVARAPNLTVDYGVRYSLYPPITDANNLLTNFCHRPTSRPTRRVRQRGGHAGPSAPATAERHRRRREELAVRQRDLRLRQRATSSRASASPGMAGKSGETVVRGLVRHLLRPGAGRHLRAERLRQPAVRERTVSLLNRKLSNPARGTSSATSGVAGADRIGDDFKTPRTQQWNVGVQRSSTRAASIEVSYVGSAATT
jgi:hypothetical protein